MPSIKKILVPIDLSPSCAWAAKHATKLARRLDARLMFLHVCSGHPRDYAAAFLAEAVGRSHHPLIVKGDPAECITGAAVENEVDLIMMPTHAHGRFRRFLLGSVTAKVLHDSDCPVWTGVHHEDNPFTIPANIKNMVQNIVCAVDYDASCVKMINWGQELAAQLKAALTIVHAIPAADEASDNQGEIKLRRYLFEVAKQRFGEICGQANIDVDVSPRGGPVAQVVREEALRTGAELVIVGRGQTQSGLGRLLTNTYSIIRNSPCPVLSI
jgi:nucleotide-binding universal stress UspA family protein